MRQTLWVPKWSATEDSIQIVFGNVLMLEFVQITS